MGVVPGREALRGGRGLLKVGRCWGTGASAASVVCSHNNESKWKKVSEEWRGRRSEGRFDNGSGEGGGGGKI